MSHDIEDIIAVLDGRPEIIDEVKHADPDLVSELSMRFQDLLKDNDLLIQSQDTCRQMKRARRGFQLFWEQLNK